MWWCIYVFIFNLSLCVSGHSMNLQNPIVPITNVSTAASMANSQDLKVYQISQRYQAKFCYRWAEPHHLRHKVWISATRFHWIKKKRTVQEKVTQGLYFAYLGRSPTEVIYTKHCVESDVLDVISCAKSQNEIFRGYDFTGGQISHFPIDFWKGLTTV